MASDLFTKIDGRRCSRLYTPTELTTLQELSMSSYLTSASN